jgi:CxxC motif-containing protein (DUF1111 family)
LAGVFLSAALACAPADRTWLLPDAATGPGGALTTAIVNGAAFQQRAANSSRDSQLYFNSGQGFYLEPWLPPPTEIETRAGLGPLFNAHACSDCHLGGGRGRPPLEAQEAFAGFVLRLGNGSRDAWGQAAGDPVYGAQLQTRAISGVAPEGTPHIETTPLPGHYDDGTPFELGSPTYDLAQLQYGPTDGRLVLSPRVAPATIGLGLLEAIPSTRLAELEDPDDADGDGISGRLNRVWDREQQRESVGRFGWKAEEPDLRQQIAAALSADLGVSSLLHPEHGCTAAESCRRSESDEPELSERVLDRIVSYLRLLSVPARRGPDAPDVARGEQLFRQAGCAGCHVPSHVTAADAALPELQSQVIAPYTDLLLHDLGPELGDGRPSYGAEGDEWRTPPLWGLGLYQAVSGHQRLLHDGRADGVAEAVLWHGGEAAAAREAFEALDADERALLVAFVESL